MDVKNVWGYTALHAAGAWGRTDGVQLLLEGGKAEADVMGHEDNTALHMTSHGGDMRPGTRSTGYRQGGREF